MGILFGLILMVLLFVGVGALMGNDWRSIPVMVLALALAFVVGGLLQQLNWTDAPTVVAVVVMGGFVLRELRGIREALEQHSADPGDQTPEEPGDSTPPNAR